MKKTVLIIMAGAILLSIAFLRVLVESDRAAANVRLAHSETEKIAALKNLIRWSYPGDNNLSYAHSELNALIQNTTDQAVRVRAQEILQSSNFRTRNILAPLAQKYIDARASLPITDTLQLEPDYSNQLLIQLTFWGWIIGVLFCIQRAFSKDGIFQQRQFLRCALFPLCMFLCWLALL